MCIRDRYMGLYDRICCILGGRCAEEIFFNRITTGAYDDLKKAYDLAHAIVTKFGMSDRIGFLGFSENEYGQRTYSEETGKVIDAEIKRIIDECTERTRQVVKTHKEHIQQLSDTLLVKETLDLRAIVDILGDRPFAPKSNYKAYLEVKRADEEEKSQSGEAEKEKEGEGSPSEKKPQAQQVNQACVLKKKETGFLG
eukprot:TRINITY_DN6426_c0_g1_i10.p1 TRINITY_DN6426_c0_g1~~TRINITY_DN6426_c0_g1_i10.p1  ORF type:complete len:197 (+),score=58.13 TRINITY_DN6426_c0_g1_i10:64-654(+)